MPPFLIRPLWQYHLDRRFLFAVLLNSSDPSETSTPKSELVWGGCQRESHETASRCRPLATLQRGIEREP
jgi:hypothetical protein